MRSGILNIYKPVGVGSTAITNRIKRMIPRRTKIGHAGTLDPFASGVLLILIGREATRLCEAMMDKSKEYVAIIRLGATTLTDDPESEPRVVDVNLRPTLNDVITSLDNQVGVIQQHPPAYSALKVAGKRASDRLRNGEAIALAPRSVRINAIDVLGYRWPDVRVRVDCGRGTYIRSIARDLGETLGVGGYLTQLERTRVGHFGVQDALRLDDLYPETLEHALHDVAELSFGGARQNDAVI